MVATTITKGPFGPRLRLKFGLSAFLLLNAFVIFSNDLSADSAPDSTDSRKLACEQYRAQLRSGRALEKDFAISALASCPAEDGTTARLLEQTIQNGDFRHRLAAFQAMEAHLGPASVDFLIQIYHKPGLRPAEKVMLFDYLGRLARPRWKSPLRRIFQEGISLDASPIRISSVLGLGRIGAGEDWEEYLAPLAANADAELLRSLLIAARLLRAEAAIELGENHLRDQRPEIALAAIELLAVLPGPRAREALLLLDFYRLPDDEPSPRQLGRILARTRSAEPAEAGDSGVTLRRGRLYAEPHDRSTVLGALAKNTIVYLLIRESGDYRLRTDASSGRWYRVATSDGLQGWMHSSNLFTLPCAGDCSADSAGSATTPAP